jgi:hypothetical protein
MRLRGAWSSLANLSTNHRRSEPGQPRVQRRRRCSQASARLSTRHRQALLTSRERPESADERAIARADDDGVRALHGKKERQQRPGGHFGKAKIH